MGLSPPAGDPLLPPLPPPAAIAPAGAWAPEGEGLTAASRSSGPARLAPARAAGGSREPAVYAWPGTPSTTRA